MRNERCVYADLPPQVKGMVVRVFEDGEYYDTIVLNSRLSWEQNLQTFKHEEWHIDHEDFESNLPVMVLEEQNPY